MNIQNILKALRAGELTAEQAKAALRILSAQTAQTAQTAQVAQVAPVAQVAQASTESASNARPAPPAGGYDPIAVVGMAGRYPGAPDLDAFWANLVAGKDSISEIPASRWDIDEFFDPTPPYRDKIYSRWLGVLEDMECFDPLFFNISPAEAEVMDPQHRLFLEESYKAFEHAGYSAASLNGAKCGVYFGVMNSEYTNLFMLSTARPSATGNSNAIGAARIAYHLNLKGPAIAIDTACSSSLVAMHLAIQGLQNHEIDMALAGGATLYLMPSSYIGMCAAGMLSPTGRCKTFDNDADGFVPGEGVGAVVLKRLADAERDGDTIHGVIIGSATNQDGKTNGITAPSKASQIELERGLYLRCGVDPTTIGYVEMHGTGTKLGDPIELEALATVYREKTAKRGWCAIGSVKSNIGHTSAAAGAAGLHKLLLALRHGALVPTLNYQRPNEHFDFAASPFYVNTEVQPWESIDGLPRRAAVSSFGFSGTNAHLIVEEYVERRARSERIRPGLFVLSARSEARLKTYARALRLALERDYSIDREDLAYTLQVGRDAMEHRLAIVSDSTEMIIRGLDRWCAGEADASVFYGVARGGKDRRRPDDDGEALAQDCADYAAGAFEVLAGRWVGGADIEWARVRAADGARRIPLPTYPFERKGYWLPGVYEADARADDAQGKLHPLLHRNLSDFDAQRYASSFTGNEFFLAGHRVSGLRVLPGAAYLEIARAGVAAACRVDSERQCVHLRDVVWLRPLVASDAAGRPISLDVELTIARPIDGTCKFQFSSADGALVCTGRAVVDARQTAVNVDLEALRGSLQGGHSLSGEAHYHVLEALGLQYGQALRGMVAMTATANAALAMVTLPVMHAADASRYVLHPALLDSAMQASLGLELVQPGRGAAVGGPALPFAIEAIDVFAPLPREMFVHAREAGDGAVRRVDLDLLDGTGLLCARVRGLCSRAAVSGSVGAVPAPFFEAVHAQAASTDVPVAAVGEAVSASGDMCLLVPVWRQAMLADESADLYARRALIVAAPGRERDELFSRHRDALVLEPADWADDAAAARSAERLRTAGRIESVYFIAPQEASGPAGEAIIAAQTFGVIACMRLLKALVDLGYWSASLAVTAVTTRTQQVLAEDRVLCAHAGVHGLVGSVAKEYPNWQVRLVDTDLCGVKLWDRLSAIPALRGETLALRRGLWYAQHLVAAEMGAVGDATTYRQHGLYVVIGGAGGVGVAWSEWMIRRYQARIVWIGRRAETAEIAAQRSRLGAFGERPLYLSADATDAAALSAALAAVKSAYGDGPIHGVVHSAIVLSDQSLANMSLLQFESGLRVKVDVCVRMAQAFAAEPLDFVLMFSSLQSFSKEPGQSNYAAGCTFGDAYAHALRRAWGCAVKVMNWGYWGSVGVVASAAYRERMAKAGIGSIEAAEGMAALETLMAGPLEQLGVLRVADPGLLEGIESGGRVQLLARRAVVDLQSVDTRMQASLLPWAAQVQGSSAAAMQVDEGRAAIEAGLAGLLFVELESLGLWPEGSLRLETAAAKLDPLYARWLRQSARSLAEHGWLQADGADYRVMRESDRGAAWQAWEELRAGLESQPDLRGAVQLVEATTRALPEILRGARPATDILFQGASMTPVEGVYQGNAGADYFNTVVAEAVLAVLHERLQSQRGTGVEVAGLRILEIGAGTGATSAVVLGRLDAHAGEVAEYCYTDISRAFLLHGESAYGSNRGYLQYRLFDVERPLEGQGIEAGGYDLVIATNVLHATRRLRRTLAHAKAALARDGVLVLNEMNGGGGLFTHLTFGLTKGWWLHEDEELRVPGSPGVLPATWQQLLYEAGFGPVLFPAEAGHGLGHQIVVARSDGIVAVDAIREVAAPQRRLAETAAAPQAVRPVVVAPTSNRVETQLRALLRELIGSVLKLAPDQLDDDLALERYGLDSIVAVQLATGLSQRLRDVDSILFLEYRTVDALVAHLLATRADSLREMFGQDDDVSTAGSTANDATTVDDIPAQIACPPAARAHEIAVIGMAGRYPSSDDIDALWDHLAAGRDCIREVPVERWDHARYYDADKTRFGHTPCKWGGFIEGVDAFDPLFFDIPPNSADIMDPQVRLCLQTVWDALEAGGQTREAISRRCGARVGVFMGAMYQQYALFECDYVVHAGVALTSYATIVNRISSYFDFKGPSVAVDTQCSSSMIAVHMACRALHDDECAMAVAGGVNLLLHPKKYIGLSLPMMLGSDARSRSFTAGDGFVPGEGVGAVVLKPLADAQRDGDMILAVIRHSAQSHGGRGMGYGTQDPNAQYELIATALERSDTDPSTITYVEAAANGTALGDAIEFAALKRAYRRDADAAPWCMLGSVKSNMGHLEAASGIAQLTKVVLQLQHKVVPPVLFTDRLNPQINLAGSPFVLPTATTAWPRIARDGRELPRRAAINTFGGGGSLCHVIVEEYAPDLRGLPETDTHAVDGEPALAVLSARTPERLRVMAQRLAERLQHDPGLSLADVCHTLQRGREAMAYRWAARVSTRAQLLDALSRLASGGRGGDEGVPVFLGEPEGAGSAVRELLTGRSSSAMARELIAAGDLHKLALYWSHGGHVDWSALATNGRLVSLPTYPFERRRCWLTETEQTRWEQSFVNDSTPVATQATHTDRDVATTVFETIRGMLGLGSEELDDGTSLGRYELLSAFLPRLRDKLMKENGIDIDTSLLGGQATVREVVAAATMLVTSSTDPTVSVFEDEDGQQIEMVTDPN